MQGQAQASQASEAGPSQQPDGQHAQERPQQRQPRQELPKNYVANMLGAIGALQKHEKYASILELYHVCHTTLVQEYTLQNTERLVEIVTCASQIRPCYLSIFRLQSLKTMVQALLCKAQVLTLQMHAGIRSNM